MLRAARHARLDFDDHMAQFVRMTPDVSRPDVAGRLAASVRQSSQDNLQVLEFHAMSTVCRVLYWGVSSSVARGFQREVLELVGGFETRYSRFVGGSWVAQINTAAGKHWVATTDEDERLLDLCAHHFTLSGGIFDVTALPLIQLWNWKQSPAAQPDASAIQAAQAKVGWPKIQRRAGGIFLPQSGMAVDFGGIGKEYAVDQMVELAGRHGVANVLVDFGQDVRARGNPPDKAFWSVGLEDPQKTGRIWAAVAARNQAVATSGDYQRHFEFNGRRYGHIIDLRTGWPASTDCRAVSVVAPTCAQAGLWATVVCVLGSQAGLELVEQQTGIAAAALTDTERFCSARFPDWVVR